MISKEGILALADNMAAAASGLNTMTYDQLMSNRKQLIDEVDELFDKAVIKNKSSAEQWYPFRTN